MWQCLTHMWRIYDSSVLYLWPIRDSSVTDSRTNSWNACPWMDISQIYLLRKWTNPVRWFFNNQLPNYHFPNILSIKNFKKKENRTKFNLTHEKIGGKMKKKLWKTEKKIKTKRKLNLQRGENFLEIFSQL